jgi:hypothetical protein
VPATLANGELAFSSNGYILYIGDPVTSANIVPIGGARFPGTLTANQALVANSSSAINQVILGQLVFTGASQTVNVGGSDGTAGYVLTSNGTSNAYWSNPAALTTNVAAQYTWTNTHIFQNTVTFGANLVVNTAAITWVGNSTASPTVSISNTGVIQSGNSTSTALPQLILSNSTGTVTVNTIAINIGNSTVNSTVNSTAFNGTANNATNLGGVAAASYQLNSTLAANVVTLTSNSANYIGTLAAASVANTSAPIFSANISVGSNVYINTSTIFVGNSTIYSISNSSSDLYVGLTSNTSVNSTAFFAGNSTVYTIANASTDVMVGLTGNLSINSTTLAIGAISATTVGLVVNNVIVTMGNTSVNATFSTAGININGATVVTATGNTTGTAANATLLNNQPASFYTNASNITTGSLPYAQIPTNVVNTTSNFTLAGNTTLAGTNTVISSNLTISGGLISAPTSNLTVQNATISGNLIVGGSVLSVNVQTLIVNDNIIELGDNNNTTDVIDTGWFSPAGNSTSIWYSGIARVASRSSNNNPVFWVFASNTNPNTSTTIDTSTNSTTGTLQSYLQPYGAGGAYVVNSTAVTVTANSTLAVNITANSLSLSTALGATSGGTGQNAVTTGDMLYGSGTNTWSRLSVGTDGQVLQLSGTTLQWGSLDGGTF